MRRLAEAARALAARMLASLGAAWARTPAARKHREFLRWRTVTLLEQIDAEAEALCDLRDFGIRRALRSLAEEKHDLLQQLTALANPDELELPLTAVPRTSATGGWSPAMPGRPGPLFQQRSNKQ